MFFVWFTKYASDETVNRADMERETEIWGTGLVVVCAVRDQWSPLSTAAATLSVCGKRWTALYCYMFFLQFQTNEKKTNEKLS